MSCGIHSEKFQENNVAKGYSGRSRGAYISEARGMA
jgi:hypothetical protein